eukprot:TRINITY_DN15155_c0_g1_i1.p1 TRINITY_DN15155_c0_g1~~TRINITY_DN15155_c0_g1_i1.p1  ORF type:complete len:631 (+),score=232.81 TRINITY_DN15155_c0_g1_i1:200-2092(+)
MAHMMLNAARLSSTISMSISASQPGGLAPSLGTPHAASPLASDGASAPVTFCCQNARCRRALEPDESLLELLTPDALVAAGLPELAACWTACGSPAGTGGALRLDKYELALSCAAPSARPRSNDSGQQLGAAQQLVASERSVLLGRLFQAAAATCGSRLEQQPLCRECSAKYLRQLETRQLRAAIEQRDHYAAFRAELLDRPLPPAAAASRTLAASSAAEPTRTFADASEATGTFAGASAEATRTFASAHQQRPQSLDGDQPAASNQLDDPGSDRSDKLPDLGSDQPVDLRSDHGSNQLADRGSVQGSDPCVDLRSEQRDDPVSDRCGDDPAASAAAAAAQCDDRDAQPLAGGDGREAGRLGALDVVGGADLASLEAELRELQRQIDDSRRRRRLYEEERGRLAGERARITQIERHYWQSFGACQADTNAYRQLHETVAARLDDATGKLEKLKVSNILNDVFHIWHDGHFGTINNFRLGRLPQQPVDWNEINAAWGQTTLLMHTIARRLNFTFSTYRLLPMGSMSKLERLSDGAQYELYGSSDISLGRLFWYRRFDNGMVAFLACLKEIGDYAESQDPKFQLPYRIDKDKIGDMSIKIQFNNEETWTRALKFLLTNLKFVVAWPFITNAL